MLLSESEAFWLAQVYDQVTRCWSMQRCASAGMSAEEDAAPPTAVVADVEGLAPPAPPINEPLVTTENTSPDGADVYKSIRDLAIAFGLARPLEVLPIPVGEQAKFNCPDQARWGIFLGAVLSTEEIQSIQGDIAARLDSARERLTADEEHNSRWQALRNRLGMLAPNLALGYARAEPYTLFALGGEGLPYACGTVPRRDQGLYRTLLELLCGSLPLPAIERIALADKSRTDEVLESEWVPSLDRLETPIGPFHHQAVLRAFNEFKASNEEHMGWRLGCQLTGLVRMVQELVGDLEDHAGWADSLVDDEESQAVNEGDDDALPAVIEEASSDETGLTTQAESSAQASEMLTFAAPEALVYFFDWVCSEAEAQAVRPPVHSEGGDDDDDSWALICRDNQLLQLRAEANDVADFCKQHGLTSVAEMVLAARSLIPDAGSPLARWTQSLQASVSDRMAGQLRDAVKLLCDAQKVAYGELRLKGLKWDEHALPAPAISGWSRQNENIRDAIKVAIDQLNNGLRPFVVMSQLAPAVEVLVRQLAAKHLTEFHGLNSGGLLRQLRQTFGTALDAHEDRATLSIAQSLVSMRNWVAHQADAEWDRDHAAFFLNGLSLLLRRV